MLAVSVVNARIAIAEEQPQGAAVKVHTSRRAAIEAPESKGAIIDVNSPGGVVSEDVGTTRERIVTRIWAGGSVAIQGQGTCASLHKAGIQLQGTIKDGRCRSSHHQGRLRARSVCHRTANLGVVRSDGAIVIAQRFCGDASAIQVQGGTCIDIQFGIQPAQGRRSIKFKDAILNAEVTGHHVGSTQGQRPRAEFGEGIGGHIAADHRIFAGFDINQGFRWGASARGGRRGRVEDQMGADRIAAVDENATRADVINGCDVKGAATDVCGGAEGVDTVDSRQRVWRKDIANRIGGKSRQRSVHSARIGSEPVCTVGQEKGVARGVCPNQVRWENAIGQS